MLKLDDLFRQISALRRSSSFKRAGSNAIYNVANTVTMPILMLAATPFWVHRMGLERFGIWMLVNALTGTMGVFNLGLGDATIKYVSTYRGMNNPDGLVRSVRSSLTMSVVLGIFMVAFIFVTAPFLARHVFKIQPGDEVLVIQAFRVGGIGLASRTLEAVFLSALRGFERYDIAAKINITSKVIAVGTAIALVYRGHGIVAILIGMVSVSVGSLIVEAVVARRLMPGFSCWPVIDSSAIREIFGFGMYTWIQSVAAVIFSQADKLLIGAMLGAGEVGVYTICVLFAQQIHSLTAAALNFVFPSVSSRYSGGAQEGVRRVFNLSLAANVLLASLLALPLIVFGRQILTLYMGSALPPIAPRLLLLLSVAFLLLSINVVPHYTLLGLGEVRFVAVTNVAGGVMSLLSAALLIPFVGVQGAAAGRLFYGPAISLNFWKAARSLR